MKFRTKPRGGGGGIGLTKSIVYIASLFISTTTLLPSTYAALSETEVLQKLYQDLNGDNWDVDTANDDDGYWTGDDICSDSSNYVGVTCNADGRVTKIALSDSSLVGSISPHVYTLAYLTELDFSKNRITSAGWDRIDEVVSGDDLLADIEVIDLTNNFINSVEGITSLKDSLTGLHLTYNNLKGPIPLELFEMDQLEILAISENELTGKIDERIGRLTNLLEFYCYGNKITGTIPKAVGNLTKMQIITFAENQMSGPLPEEMRNMGNLQTFSVHNNDPDTGSHTGQIPSFDHQPFLNEIYLDGNAFTGTIPSNLLHAFQEFKSSPVTIGLSNNQLEGSIPIEFLKFDSLTLNIVGNNITSFDDRICDSGDIGDWMNGLVEMFGCDAILCPAGEWSDTGRQEEDQTPCQVCAEGTGGVMGSTTCASEEGPVETNSEELEILAEFYLALGGPQWQKDDEDLTGWEKFIEMESPEDLTLPSYQEMNIDPCKFTGVECDSGKVVSISLSNAGLEGLVPSSLWDLPKLRELDLAGNEVRLARDYGFGDIANAQSLKKVDLSSNDIQKFTGLGASTSIVELVVDDAYFFSSLDENLYKMEQLQQLHMQFSGIKGVIPVGMSKLKNLIALNLYGNEITGQIPQEIGQMTKLWHVDLSENDFEGHLPTEAIKKLVNLQKFHVHQSGRGGSGITGKLPSFLEQTKLHMLDVNSNAMTGSIPDDFLGGVANVTQLMQIDIGYNEFIGTIPESLKRFSNMRLDAVKNKITGVNTALCTLRGWWDGEVGEVIDKQGGGKGCDAILCPKGTYNDFGRAKGGDTDGACLPCPSEQYAGATTCDSMPLNILPGVTEDTVNTEKKILDKLWVATGGPQWTKGATWSSEGAICDYEGVTCLETGDNVNKGVTELRLAGFGLTSNIITDIYKLPSLKVVDFSNNIVDLSFDGINEASNLEEILINDADLISVEGISNAKKLKKLHIARNSFPEGDIPDELYKVTTLESLAMSYNGFEGSISPDVKNLAELQEFWAGSNDITGSIPVEFSQLPKLRSLVLSGNRMSGEIPNELEGIPALKQLHLNGQRDFGGLTGPIPSFSTSEHLHDMDFSKNSLTGSIPVDFLETVRKSKDHADYAYDKIDLSENQITGTLPDEWDDFVGLFTNFAGNRITGVSPLLCDDDDEFMNGLVGNLTDNKCNAILCPPGTSSPVGRQTSPEDGCKPCEGSSPEQEAPYFGSLKCNAISKEREILQEIHGLIFTGASEDTYWMSDHPICTWHGIKCENEKDDFGVNEIKLESNSLSTDDPEKVSKLFFDLPKLQSLNIRGNEGLPLDLTHVGTPPMLTLLQVSATGLTSIAGIGQATKLKELHFTENDIEGTFPEEIFELTSMERLYTSFNKISGPLPTRIGELTGLVEFYAYTNNMTGPLPTELGNLISIENLVLGQNNFNGKLPTELNNLENLKEFSVYYNKEMTGKVLDFAQVKMIEKLDLEGNQFTGEIPSTFLSGLDADYKSNPDNEIILHLADNALKGPLPEGLSSIQNLYLDISGNQFTTVPASYCQNSEWMNGKVGTLKNNPCHAIACPPNTYSETGRMYSDGEEVCTSCGSDASTPFIGSYTCSHVDMEANALKALYRSTNGESWKENENWMIDSKPICSWFGVECAGDSLENNTITAINLPHNLLEGTIPHQIWELPHLQTLNLKENSIFIGFMNSDKATKLEVLYLSDIDLGNIDNIGKLPALKELHLTANELKGELPDDFYDLADTLERLYIAYNHFSGKLSTKFGQFKNLIDFYAYDNEFTGNIPSEFASLPNLQNLVLAENRLSGTIAEEFSYMPQLKLFSAYRRLKPGPKLSGPLPSFSNVPNLEGLYLDYNHLEGTIPSDFLKSSLSTKLVTISHNYLSGGVPTELAVFDDLNIEMEGNKITDFDERFCKKQRWMDGRVTDYDCDAIMCKPGYYSIYGRQNTTDSACKRCVLTGDAQPTPYWGSISCDPVVDETEILKLLYSETNGDDWHNNDNWMETDNICTWYGIDCRDGTSVQSIQLGANNLVGTPPEELFTLKQLHTLWLHSNPIDFKFEGIGKAKNLVELRLDQTGLSGVYGVGDASALIKLDLKYNQIAGSFPSEFFNMENLKSLALTDNDLTGALPDSFGKLKNLIELRLGSNLFSGQLKSFSDLDGLYQLDLSDNDLVGTIPMSFLNKISERQPIEVDLSSNNLSGSLPLQLDRLDQLVIYLRDNKFTELSPTLCDENNEGWNLREVELFGCNGIMCPPGTANYRGRQTSETNTCLKCESNADLYGQITCDGVPLMASSSSRLQGVVGILTSSLLVGVFLI